jgi:probable HAF family extracellular repeat protein
LPGGSDPHSVADDVSADGSVVVGISWGAMGLEAYRWTTQTGMVGLGDLPGGNYFSDAAAVSADGSTVAGRSNSQYSGPESYQHEAFRWTAGQGMDGLGDFFGGPFSSWSTGVSGDGEVVVGAGTLGAVGPPPSEAFRWTPETGMVGLGDLVGGSVTSRALGVSEDGSVVVGGSVSWSGVEAFRWTEETGMVGLGDLPGGQFQSVAEAVSADGNVVIGYGDVGLDEHGQRAHEIFRWTEETGMVGLGFNGEPEDVSADGSVIVGLHSPNAPFVWDEAHGVRDLADVLTDLGVDLTGWTLWRAYGVSADGNTIVGCAYNPDGYLEAYVAHIPEPSTLALLTLATLIAARRQRQVRERPAPKGAPASGGPPLQTD